MTTETAVHLVPQVGPIEVALPGSVQKALLDSGVIPDWNHGTNSLAAEWVENRHWSFETYLPSEWCNLPGRKVLCCNGLDHAGEIVCGGTSVGSFSNAFIPQEFDLTVSIASALATGAHAAGVRLAIVFTDAPRYLGQVNYTSRIRDFKPRFYYIWDWVVRLVQIGIWDTLSLRIGDAAIDHARSFTEFDQDRASGRVRLSVASRDPNGLAKIRAELLDGERVISSAERKTADGETDITLEATNVDAWWPNGMGRQRLYTVRVALLDSAGRTIDTASHRVGFRHIEWKPCKGAPAGAEPWLLHVNGKPVFMLGCNWVPIRPNFADVREADYRKFIGPYRDCGFNILRVWGGAVLEREVFYTLCDEMGILVWQEFPFSSSGHDNYPPDDEYMVSESAKIAESYVRRRQHHPSLVIWCGGNELQVNPEGKPIGGGRPLDESHPTLRAMGDVVRKLDPTRKYVPTSSTGPRFMADEKEFGLGLHHDVHGPWKLPGTMDEWKHYWDRDDALLRSETGVPGAQSVQLMRKHLSGNPLPGNLANPFWRHSCSWWTQWEEYFAEGGRDNDLEHYVHWSQQKQAEALSYAVAACRKRFPRCGGFIVWMGHDCFPCPVNTSIFDFEANPKPAALAIRDCMRQFE